MKTNKKTQEAKGQDKQFEEGLLQPTEVENRPSAKEVVVNAKVRPGLLKSTRALLDSVFAMIDNCWYIMCLTSYRLARGNYHGLA